MNQIFSAFVAFVVIVSGYLGFAEDPFEKEVSDNVDIIDNAVLNVKNAYGVEDVPHFRASVSGAQGLVSRHFLNANNDIGLSEDNRELNKKYKSYLAQAGTILDIYDQGRAPESEDWKKYEDLRDELR